MKMDNNAQMMVLEAVVFSISVIISISFLFQISPTATLTDQYTKELKIQGDDALRSLYFEPYTYNSLPSNYPSGKLINYIIEKDYTHLIIDLNKILLSTEYNIRISNGTTTIFWCNSYGDYTVELEPRDEISTSHCLVAIDPNFLVDNDRFDAFKTDGVLLCNAYKVILEIWSLE